MSNSSNRLAVSSAYSAANYLPATLKTNKSGWLVEYYVEKNPGYLAFLELIYGALLRPREILKLKVGDVSFKEKTITVRAEVSKNGKQRIVPMTKEIEQILFRMNPYEYPSEFFLFSREQRPGTTPFP